MNSLDLTILFLLAMQVVLSDTYRSLRSAVTEVQDEDDRRIVRSWTEIQTMLGARLAREREAGLITDEQYEFILAWLSEWIDYGPEEAEALLTAWLQWIGREPVCSTRPA